MKSLEQAFISTVKSFTESFENVPWENKATYGFWVRQQLALVRHTTRFICLAAARTEIGKRDEHNEWLHHLRGELNHDLVAKKDLENLGFTEDDFPVLWSTDVIKQNQYYWLQNQNPVALCGYSLLLEGLASQVAPLIIRRLEPVYDRNQYAFLTLHAAVDQEHFAEGLKFTANLQPDVQNLIQANLKQSEQLYKALLRDVAQPTAQERNFAA